MSKSKEIDLNRTCYYFNDIISVNELAFDKILPDGILCDNCLIYHAKYTDS